MRLAQFSVCNAGCNAGCGGHRTRSKQNWENQCSDHRIRQDKSENKEISGSSSVRPETLAFTALRTAWVWTGLSQLLVYHLPREKKDCEQRVSGLSDKPAPLKGRGNCWYNQGTIVSSTIMSGKLACDGPVVVVSSRQIVEKQTLRV